MLHFNPPSGWIFLFILLAFGLTFWSYRRHPAMAELKPSQVRWLGLLRSVALLLVMLLLLRPFLTRQHSEQIPPKIILAVDNSKSMLQQGWDAQELREAIGDLRADLLELAEVDEWIFDGDGRPLATDSLRFNGQGTHLQALLQRIESSYGGDPRFRGLVMLSDGQANQGSDPRLQARGLSYPVFTLGIGSPPEGFDAAIVGVRHNASAEVGNRLEITGRIKVRSGNGKNLQLLLKDESSTLLDSKTIRVSSSADSYPFSFFPEVGRTLGERHWNLELVSEEEEELLSNNQSALHFEVVERNALISLIYDAPHPDIAALAASIRDFDAYQIEYVDVRKGEEPDDQAVVWVVVHPGNNAINAIAQWQLNRKTPVFWLAGYDESAQGLQTLSVPVRFDPQNGEDDEVSPSFAASFSAFSLSDEYREQLGKGAPLSAPYGKWSFAPDVKIQLYQKIGNLTTEKPLLATFKDRKGTDWAVLTAQGLWRWRLQAFRVNGNTRAFDAWISAWLRYLQKPEEGDRLQVETQRELALGSVWELTARLKDASNQWSRNAKMQLTIVNPQGKEQKMEALVQGERYRFRFRPDQAGNYKLQLNATLGAEQFQKKLQLEVSSSTLEEMQLGADTTLLAQIAVSSGGQYHSLENRNRMDWRNSLELRPLLDFREETIELIHWKWLFALIVLFLTAEWALRRYFGIY